MRSRLVPALVLVLTVVTAASACSGSSSGKDDAAPSQPPSSAPPEVFPAVWPFTSQGEVDAYLAAKESKYTDPEDTAVAFAKEYLGMTAAVAIGKASSNKGTREVKLGVGTGEGGAAVTDPKPSMGVFLKAVGPGGGPPYAVIGSKSVEIVLSSPADYAKVSSPVRVAGAASATEGKVEVEVREDGQVTGKALGVGNVAGAGDGKLGPFDNGIYFKTPTRTAGAVVLLETGSAAGQGITRATVVRVAF
jgi:hypothetical protein